MIFTTDTEERSKVQGPRSKVDEMLIVCSDSSDIPDLGPWTLDFGPFLGVRGEFFGSYLTLKSLVPAEPLFKRISTL